VPNAEKSLLTARYEVKRMKGMRGKARVKAVKATRAKK